MKKYWLLIIICYALFFVLNPPLQTPDENDHYETVYWLSRGIYPSQPTNSKPVKPRFTDELYYLVDLKMKSPKRNLNLPNFQKIGKSELKTKTGYSQAKSNSFKPITLQSYQTPLYHLSAAAIFKLGQALNLSLWHQSYFTRLTSTIYYFALVWLALLILRQFYKSKNDAAMIWLLFSLNPQLIRSGLSINPDIAMAFFAALFLFLLLKAPKQAVLLGLTSAAASLSKFSGVFTIPVGLIILWQRRAKFRQFWLFIAFALLPLLPWFYLNYSRYGTITTTHGFFLASSHEIIPRSFWPAVFLAIADFRHTLMHFGGFLGAGNERYPFKFFFGLYTVVIALGSFLGLLKMQKSINKKSQALFIYSFFYLGFLLYLAFFFQKSGLNWDIQGRYFLNGFLVLAILLGQIVKPKVLGLFAVFHYLFILCFVLIPGYYV
jgi:4-amino-4-deoxy-L-arabinose transferase-like glycosyltransferase